MQYLESCFISMFLGPDFRVMKIIGLRHLIESFHHHQTWCVFTFIFFPFLIQKVAELDQSIWWGIFRNALIQTRSLAHYGQKQAALIDWCKDRKKARQNVTCLNLAYLKLFEEKQLPTLSSM